MSCTIIRTLKASFLLSSCGNFWDVQERQKEYFGAGAYLGGALYHVPTFDFAF